MNWAAGKPAAAEMLAYVDRSLPPVARAAFEKRMAESPEIKRQIEHWLRQNEAIRAAFAAPPTPALAHGGRTLAQGLADARRRGAILPDPDNAPAARPRAPVDSRLVRASAPAPRSTTSGLERRGRTFAGRFFTVIAAATALWVVAGVLPERSGSAARVEAAVAAYRTFADNRLHPVEITSADPGIVRRWFARQLGHAPPIPDLADAGLALLGARIVPGAFAPAEFIVYENAGGDRIGLAIEALDAPPPRPTTLRSSNGTRAASWTDDRYGYVVLSRLAEADVSEIVLRIRAGAPQAEMDERSDGGSD